MAIPVWEGYEERINAFRFNERAAIKIPKAEREKAFSMQIDIEILSTRGNDYKNYKSIPAHSFYGYAVLVLRDHAEIQIPITQPRQVIYYERREDAFSNWYALYLSFLSKSYLGWISEFQLKPIAEALNLSVGLAPDECPLFSGFEEVRIREVYVKCAFGTRFKLEVSQWEPLPAVYGTCSYDGNSRQIDDEDKDGGLPDTGTQPQTAPDASNPYDGFDPPSNGTELGDWDNINKIDDVDQPNSANAASSYYWLELRGSHKSEVFEPICQERYVKKIIPIESLEVEYTLQYDQYAESSSCGGGYGNFLVYRSGTNDLLGGFGFLDAFSATISYQSGTSLPADIIYSPTPIP